MSNILNFFVESSSDVEILTERKSTGTELFIEGIFAQAEVVNGNRRLYPKEIMEKAMDAYDKNFIARRKAIGELKHPDYPFPDIEQAAILVTELKWDGNDVYGKAKILPTPKGQIIQGLVEGGYQMSVSTRALGSLKENSQGVSIVQDDLMFTAVDCVDNPSAPGADVNMVRECKKYMMNESGIFVEYNEPKEIDQDKFSEAIQDFIKNVKLK